jgi:hypothetical protein
MKKPFRSAFNALAKLGVPVFTRADHEQHGNFAISAEDSESDLWVSYYSMNPEWVFGVHPKVDAVLRDYGLFAEWESPGSLNVWRA